jgi:threonyl-tRNA synthetase
VTGPITVGEVLKKLDRDLAKQALAARVDAREVDLAFTLTAQQNGEAVKIEPVLPETLEGLEVLRHSTAHLLAAAVLDLYPGTKQGIGPALLDDPRYGFFCDVTTPQALTEADLAIIEKRMRQIVAGAGSGRGVADYRSHQRIRGKSGRRTSQRGSAC